MDLKKFILVKSSKYRFKKVSFSLKDESLLDLVRLGKKRGQSDKEKFLLKIAKLKDIRTKSNFVFILRNLDFSLWKYPENWQYRKEKGFFGLMERVIDLFNLDPAKINFQVFKKIISPKEDLKLAKLRFQVFCSVIRFLNKYNNNFFNYFEENKKPLNFCLNLFKLKKFRDYYKNLYFLKPNQLLYYEFVLSQKLDKKFTNELEELTVFADYKLIQLFLNLNLIKLSKNDLNKIKNKQIIESHSLLENELRLATILLGEEISKKKKTPSYMIDTILWSLSHKIKLKIPHPRVFTIFY